MKVCSQPVHVISLYRSNSDKPMFNDR